MKSWFKASDNISKINPYALTSTTLGINDTFTLAAYYFFILLKNLTFVPLKNIFNLSVDFDSILASL